MGRFRYHRCAFAHLIVHIFAGTAEAILAGVMALVNFESLNACAYGTIHGWFGVGMVVVFRVTSIVVLKYLAGGVFLTFRYADYPDHLRFMRDLLSVTHSGWFGAPLMSVIFLVLFGYIGVACLCSSVCGRTGNANGAGR